MDNLASQDLTNLWVKVLEQLKKDLSEVSVERWFQNLRPSSTDSGTLVVDVPDDFFKNWILDHYASHLTNAIKSIEPSLQNFQLIIKRPSANATFTAPSIGSTKPENDFNRAPKPVLPLNPRYTFDEFVIGPSNRFAHAASLAVAEQPAKAYNPLFIYGPVGLGKTHLMHAVGHEVVKHNPNANVLYITSEKFTNELINAIQNRTTLKFREKFRNVDVLLIDDIHFIGGKEATQEEFFHTFNSLYDSHKQIVVSSDRQPKDINNLEERLVSRFEWGLVTDIQPADFETRAAILKKKAERDRINVPDEVSLFIAEKVQSNIRELEGALVRVVAFSQLISRPISLDVAQEALKNYIKEVERKITIPLIQKRVAEHYGIKTSDLSIKKRTKNVVLPRQVAMFLARELTEFSLPEIGQQFGGRDHTTVLHACEKIRNAVDKDGGLKDNISTIRRVLTD